MLVSISTVFIREFFGDFNWSKMTEYLLGVIVACWKAA